MQAGNRQAVTIGTHVIRCFIAARQRPLLRGTSIAKLLCRATPETSLFTFGGSLVQNYEMFALNP